MNRDFAVGGDRPVLEKRISFISAFPVHTSFEAILPFFWGTGPRLKGNSQSVRRKHSPLYVVADVAGHHQLTGRLGLGDRSECNACNPITGCYHRTMRSSTFAATPECVNGSAINGPPPRWVCGRLTNDFVHYQP